MLRHIKVLLAVLICGVIAQVAWAQSNVNSANAPMREWIDTGNSANKLLCATIGDVGGTGLFGTCEASATATLHKILKVFNVAVFSLAALFALWNVLSKMMTSANEGEFLGRQTSSTWAPLRMVIGGAMLVPAFGGFNLAQLVMIWATAVGVGIAGAAVSSAGVGNIMGSNVYSPPQNLVGSNEILRLVSDQIECVNGWAFTGQSWTDAGVKDRDATSMTWGPTVSAISVGGEPYIEIKFGETSGRGGYANDDCGVSRIPLPNPDTATDPLARNILSVTKSEIQASAPMLVQTAFAEARTLMLAGDAATEAERNAALMRIRDAADIFDQRVQTVGANAAADSNHARNQLTVGRGDWVSIGFGSMRQAFVAAQLEKGSGGKPEAKQAPRDPIVVPPCNNKLAVSEAASMNRGQAALARANAAITQTTNPNPCAAGQRAATERAIAARDESNDAAAKERAKQEAGLLEGKITNFMSSAVAGLGKSVAGALTSAGSDPIAMLVNLGVSLSGWAFVVLMGVLGVMAALALFTFPIPGLGGVFMYVGMIIIGIVTPILFFGVKLAAYIPFIIAVIWAAALLNWLVIVVESLWGAPLWAMVHLDMDGDGLNMQRTGHGYMFLLNLLFRPIMMVGAYIFAGLAMKAIFGLFVGELSSAIGNLSSSTSRWWAGLLLIIGAVWIIVVFAEQIIGNAYGLIFQIPDKVFQWIGGHFGSTVGADLERSVGGDAKGGLSSAGGTLGRGAGEVGGGLRDAGRHKAGAKDRAHSQELQRRQRDEWAVADAAKAKNTVKPPDGGTSKPDNRS